MSFDRRRLLIANAAKKSGVTLGSLAVGDGLVLNMQGAAKNFVVAHKGAPSYSGSLFAKYAGFDGGVIVLADFASQFWSTNPTWDSWADSVWTETMSGFKAFFDASVQEAIMPVTIPYRTSYNSASSSASQSVWVPSASECGRDTVDGGTFDYFADSATRAGRLMAIFQNTGEYVQYVTRSGYEQSNSSYLYLNVSASGTVSSSNKSSQYCRLALVLPEDFVVKVPE